LHHLPKMSERCHVWTFKGPAPPEGGGVGGGGGGVGVVGGGWGGGGGGGGGSDMKPTNGICFSLTHMSWPS
jgi:hypothetical protein